MIFNPILPRERIDAMRAGGFWPDRLITEYVDQAAESCPDQVAVTGANSMTGRVTTLSYRQLRRMGNRMALGLVALGVESGDVVSFQLPNWWQVSALYLACTRIGAVINPLMPIFRHREMEFMLGFGETKVLLIPHYFRGFSYPRMMNALRSKLPALEHVLVIGGEDGEDGQSFEAALLNRRWEDEMDGEAIFAERRPGPNDVSELIYTSGTTGHPKGVMHTSNTIIGNIQQIVRKTELTSADVILMASPLAHNTGFLYGVTMAIMLHAKLVLQDIWNPIAAAQHIQDEGVTFTMGSTPFLSDLTHNPGVERYDLSSLKTFITAGAPIPRVLVQAAMDKIGMAVVSGWGMTENGLVTTTRLGDPPGKVFETDGAPFEGMELRVVDEDHGAPLPTGEEGRLQARGSANFVGYLKHPEDYAMDGEGWFETGDKARLDAEGYIRITGRSKDIIIRGGENVPVVEVEELLHRHPSVQDAAIVAMPDERLGERGCVFIVLREGAVLTFEEMASYLSEANLARNYLPERMELLGEMPRTPSGKIQKFKLREMAKEFRVEPPA